MESRRLRKERVGQVTSNKMDKTITVAVHRKEKHPIYGKFVTRLPNLRLTMKKMSVVSAILYASWRLVR